MNTTDGEPAGLPGDGVTIHIWRHPRAQGADGRCIGPTNLAVARRKAKRLAHRIRAYARRHNLPRHIVTSPLRRCADVGRILAGWGWLHRLDAALIEVDFGTWEGRAWCDIPRAEIDRWCADLLNNRPGGGESVAQLLARIRAWHGGQACLVVGHGGWISAALWLTAQRPVTSRLAISPAEWPPAPPHASRTAVRRPVQHSPLGRP